MAIVKLIKFGSPDCGPCQAMKKAKTLERLQEKFGDRLEIESVDIQLEPPESLDGLDEKSAENEERATDFNVSSLPTLIFVDENGIELRRHEEAVAYPKLEELTEEVIEQAQGNAKRAAKKKQKAKAS